MPGAGTALATAARELISLTSLPLLLAIEPDSRQASLIAALAQGPLRAEVLVASSAREALSALDGRVPDLILTSQLLSAKDESVLTDRLRELDAAGMQVQTLVIPVLADPVTEPQQQGGLLSRLGWRRVKSGGTDGCDPSVFADQIREYLKRSDRVFTHVPDSSLPVHAAEVAEVEPLVLESSLQNEEPNAATSIPEPDVHVFEPATSVVEDWRLNAPVAESSLPIDARPDDAVVVPAEAAIVEEANQLAEDAASLFEAAMRAELASMFAAVPIVPAPEPRAWDEHLDTPAPSSMASFPTLAFDPPAPYIAPSDLLEMLADIQRDIEPLRMDRSRIARTPSIAVQDEWGFFDPKRCGIAALLARLEQIGDTQERDGRM
jgi:hypothetical protein